MGVVGFGKKKFEEYKADVEEICSQNPQFVTKYRNFGVRIRDEYSSQSIDVGFLFGGSVSDVSENYIINLENLFNSTIKVFKKKKEFINYNIIVIIDKYSIKQQFNLNRNKSSDESLKAFQVCANACINDSKMDIRKDVFVYIVEFLDNSDGGRPINLNEYRNRKLESQLGFKKAA